MSAIRATCLVRCLRDLARDKKNTARLRLEACEMLMAIDPTVKVNSGTERPKPNGSRDFSAILASLTEKSSSQGC
jgi:hypothetical protein